MTHLMLASGARFPLPRSATEAPWNSSTAPCSTPTPDGSGATIHPSVVDLGRRWHGFRWWMANTPYPNKDDSTENPCIYGSNDRRTWVVPSGVTNPLVSDPGGTSFHSDTELVWDPDMEKLYLYYRLADTSTSPSTVHLMVMSSPDGTTWTSHGSQLEMESPRLSPAICRAGEGDWRMWLLGSVYARMWSAPGPLGPWSPVAMLRRDGADFSGWHGDVIWHGGKWIYAFSMPDGDLYTASSADGIAWIGGGKIATDGAGWDTQIYRPTILPSSEAGYVDCWYSAYGAVTGGCATDYVRLPDTLWPAT